MQHLTPGTRRAALDHELQWRETDLTRAREIMAQFDNSPDLQIALSTARRLAGECAELRDAIKAVDREMSRSMPAAYGAA